MSCERGVIHVTKDEIERALRDPSYRFRWEQFDSADGLPGTIQRDNPYPKAIQGTDGRIWFVGTRGVAWIDPKNFSRNAIPPPVSITSISADGSSHAQMADLRFPPHTNNVQIEYTALSLSVPERVRFRYKLDGIDKQWQDTGTRRDAYYDRLPPGRFTFHVIASNNDGIWNAAGASLDFDIAPAYYQTRWFLASCAAAFLALLWALYRLRLHQIAQGFNARMEERVGERPGSRAICMTRYYRVFKG